MNELGIACAWYAIFEAFRRWTHKTKRGLLLADNLIMREAFVTMNEWSWPALCAEAMQTLERYPMPVNWTGHLRRAK